MPEQPSQRECKSRETRRWWGTWRVSKPLSFLGGLLLSFAAFLIYLTIRSVAGSGGVAEAAGAAAGLLALTTVGYIVGSVWPDENQTEWRFNPSWGRVQHLLPRIILAGGLMMLVLGLVLSFFLGFKAAMTSVVTLTTLACVAHLVGHGLIESRPVEGEQSLESVNDQTSGKPGA